jgi:lactoylglutathione lyase
LPDPCAARRAGRLRPGPATSPDRQLGTAYGHIALGVPDIYKTCEGLAAEGVKIPRPPGPMKHGSTVIAFIEDPDGYKVELIERK